jgi:hypothetical protein
MGSGKIEVIENGKVVKTVPIKGNLVTYGIAIWMALGLSREGSSSDGDDALENMKFALGEDLTTNSTRTMANLVDAFVTPKEKVMTYDNCTFAGVVIAEGGSGTPERLHVTWSATFPVGMFNGSETVGEIGLFFDVGVAIAVPPFPNISAGYYMIARICVADGDFSSVTPTSGQGIVVTYQMDL